MQAVPELVAFDLQFCRYRSLRPARHRTPRSLAASRRRPAIGATPPSAATLDGVSMISLRKFCGCSLLWLAAFFLTCGLAEATLLYENPLTITGADPTQLGRLSRSGIPSDWSVAKPFPGVINPATSYHYTTIDLDLDALEAPYVAYGGLIQISLDN